ncbi:MAG: HEAT repeat domain-containing protein [Pirellulaceae bacterium]
MRCVMILLAVWLVPGVVRVACEDPPSVAHPHALGLAWSQDLATANRDALTNNRPILVRAGSDSCVWCERLESEIADPGVQTELRRWTLLYIDVDSSPSGVAEWGIGPVPALRALSTRGRLLKSHDGFLAAADLVTWLQQSFAEATAAPDALLLGKSTPALVDVLRLVRLFDNRDATVREAAMQRLAPFPQAAGPAVMKSFREGNLATRLATYEILQQWNAPVAGLDPWEMDTFTPERLAALDQWLQETGGSVPSADPQPLTDEERESLLQDVQRMLQADEDEAAATCERLARFGQAALPDVVALLSNVTSDVDRRRLLTLRYRLVSGGSIVLTWPGGLRRLADTDPQVRHKAAEELASSATEEEQLLLLELFSDPDPLVRELSLRGLRNVGGEQATAALGSLLKDPEPNVRAAVLKQLSEDAPGDMVDVIAEYVKQESDPDLIVHAVRYFRESKKKAAVGSLLALLEHDSWQVRAEAAEAVSGFIESLSRDFSNTESEEETPDIYEALLKRLDDPDAFVVNRVLAALEQVDAERAVEPLVRAATKHKALAPQAVAILARGSHMQEAAIPHLRTFFASEDATLRAAAVSGLCQADPDNVKEVLLSALADPHSEVRVAAATSALELLGKKHLSQQGSSGPVFMSRAESTVIIDETGPGFGARVAENLWRLLSPKTLADSPPPAAEATPPDDEQVPVVAAEEPQASEPIRDPFGPTPAEEEEAKEPDDKPPLDAWLAELYAGQHRPAWMNELIEPLRSMLGAESLAERRAAALALLPFGLASESLPVLLAAVRDDPNQLVTAPGGLRWIGWEERSVLFQSLLAVARNDAERAEVVSALSEVDDPRTIEVYWSLLEREDISRDLLQALQHAIRRACFGETYYDRSSLTTRRRKQAMAAIEPHVATGPAKKRLTAIALLAPIAAERAMEESRRLTDDASVAESVRLDAFQLLLLIHTPADRTREAIAALADPDPRRQRIGLRFLATGTDSLALLSDSGIVVSLELFDDVFGMSSMVFNDGQAIIPEPPRTLQPAHVRPLLTSTDPELAAFAGYLLTLLGEPDGLEPLLTYWRSQTRTTSLDRLVYRAIAVRDDPQYIPILRDIYARLRQEWELKQFYWTVRIMSGPEILEFRKRLRREIGITNLQ